MTRKSMRIQPSVTLRVCANKLRASTSILGFAFCVWRRKKDDGYLLPAINDGDTITVKKSAPRKLSKRRRWTAAGFLAGGVVVSFTEAPAATLIYEVNKDNGATGVMRLSEGTLSGSVLSNPKNLKTGSNTFNFGAVLVRPTFGEAKTPVAPQQLYRFGQNKAPADTVMILYEGRFDSLKPGLGALVGNDDSSAHPSDVKMGGCSNSTSACPSIAYTVTAGQVYSLVISTYRPGSALGLPQSFYSTGQADFGRFDGLASINPVAAGTGLSYNSVYDLDFRFTPEFRGGVMRMDKPYGTIYNYAQDFLVSSDTGNTVDLYGHDTKFTGVWSDVSGQAGAVKFVNSVGQANLDLVGNNTFSGGLTIANGVTLNVTSSANLGGEKAVLSFDGGALQTKGALSTSRPVVIRSMGGIWDAGGTVTLSGQLSGSGILRKNGVGALILTGDNDFFGTLTISDGSLQVGAGQSGVLSNANVRIVNNSLGSVVFSRTNATSFSGSISGTGGVKFVGGGILTLSGANTHSGGTTISAGSLIALNGGVFGSGLVTNDAALDLSFASDSTLANRLAGAGALSKTGTGVATLTGQGSTVGALTVSEGTLKLEQNGVLTAQSYQTRTKATTSVGASSQLVVAGAFTQDADAILSATIGSANAPLISADSASLDGTLQIAGFDANRTMVRASDLAGTEFTVVKTQKGISKDFASIDFGGASSAVDYLTLDGRKSADGRDYSVGFGLTWLAGATKGDGTFTLANAADRFDLDLDLTDQADTFKSGWDGKSLTKAGAGTLVLSATNGYTGATTINGGMLQAGIADAFAQSGAVNLAAGATLDLNGFNQRANDLSGEGSVTLGKGTLSANIASAKSFGGVISGDGSLVKSGAGEWTLSGANTHSGGTTISAGSLIALNGGVFGSGLVTNDAALDLSFASDSTLANRLAGAGALSKTGTGVATLTGQGSTVGALTVSEGTLKLEQNGVLTAQSYQTRTKATTSVGASSQLVVAGAFTQDADAILSATIGSANAPLISADSASLDGTLQIAGFDANRTMVPLKASEALNRTYRLISTTSGIAGDFVLTPLQQTGLDYITYDGAVSRDGQNYDVGMKLSWTDGSATSSTGTFTIDKGKSFDADVILKDQNGTFVNGWDGASLVKAGEGLMVLSSDNAYTKGTTINDGVLQVSRDKNLGATSGDLTFNGGYLAAIDSFETARDVQLSNGMGGFDVRGGNTLTLNGDVSGSGGLNIAGLGELRLNGHADYVGDTVVNSGTLAAGGLEALSVNSEIRVKSGANLKLEGFDQVVRGLDNAGNVFIGDRSGERVGAIFTVSGAYTSNGGNLFLNTVLGDDNSKTDKLVADAVSIGNRGAIGVPTRVYVNNVGGLGARTTGDGIKIVHVNDPSKSAAGAFALGQRVAAGAFTYQLHQGSMDMSGSDGNWYLRTENDYRDEVVISSTIGGSLGKLGMALLSGFSGRDGGSELHCQEVGPDYENSRCMQPRRSGWANVVASSGKSRFEGDNNSVGTFEKYGANTDHELYGFVSGLDILRDTRLDGSSDVAGVYFGTASIHTGVGAPSGLNAGSSSIDGYSIGGYWSHMSSSGWYLGGVLQSTRYSSIESSSASGQSVETTGWAIIASTETGYKFKLDNNWSIVPQAQLTYQHSSISGITDDFGQTHFHGADDYALRGGIKLHNDWTTSEGHRLQTFASANVWHSFGPQHKITTSTLDGMHPVTIATGQSSSWIHLNLGLSGQLTDQISAFAAAEFNKSIGKDSGSSISVKAGLKVNF
ncbi:autotransporter outer membrane beta-barrel domain-containing protein [Agrobacterium tumefaciens]|uniref:autotransporter outer membrane beta-barrel domain-containing protein n=1 Tax=Agrobacterium tumefaciens TaxID=358 RepID=UPI001572B5AF|nr:autotransporter outer membrane beta-barrel domain-containing protein [Agrobacterium tumefaciens]NSZ72078.1 autotransporter outer membrane beta-barrel domain-containing protein [Agrobacterium tumefaciens]